MLALVLYYPPVFRQIDSLRWQRFIVQFTQWVELALHHDVALVLPHPGLGILHQGGKSHQYASVKSKSIFLIPTPVERVAEAAKGRFPTRFASSWFLMLWTKTLAPSLAMSNLRCITMSLWCGGRLPDGALRPDFG